MAKSVCIIHITNTANIEKLGQYRKTRPIRLVLAQFFTIGRVRVFFYKLINKIVNNQVNSYWPSYRSSVCCIGPRPRTNTADLGPVIGPIRNNLINNIIKLVSWFQQSNFTIRGDQKAHVKTIFYIFFNEILNIKKKTHEKEESIGASCQLFSRISAL